MWKCWSRPGGRVDPGSTAVQYGNAADYCNHRDRDYGQWSFSRIRGPPEVELHLDDSYTRRPVTKREETKDGSVVHGPDPALSPTAERSPLGYWEKADSIGATPFLKKLLRRQIQSLTTFASTVAGVDVEVLLRQRYSTPEDTPEELRVYEGENALHIVVAQGNLDLAEEMLKYSAVHLLEGRATGSYFKLNGPCGLGEHPLFFAVGLDNRKMAQLLLAKGACSRSKDSSNHSLLHLAVFRNLPEMFQFVLEILSRNCKCHNCRKKGRFSAVEMHPMDTVANTTEEGHIKVETLAQSYNKLAVEPPVRLQVLSELDDSVGKPTQNPEGTEEPTQVDGVYPFHHHSTHEASSLEEQYTEVPMSPSAKKKVLKLPHPDQDPCCQLSDYQMTPVVLAAELGRLEVMEFVLRRRSRKLYTYAGMEARLYSLQDLDNFPTYFYTRRYPDAPCVLDVLARYTWNSRLDAQLRILDHPVIANLVEKKWTYLARPLFHGQFVLALLHTAVLTAAFVTHRVARYTPADYVLMCGVGFVATVSFSLFAVDFLKHWRGAIFDIGGVPMFREFANLAYEMCVLASGLLQAGGSPSYWEAIANAGVIILGYADLLYFFLGWELTGTFAVMVWTILTKDVARFVLLYFTFLVSFTLALYGGILYDPDDAATELQDAFLHPVGTFLGGVQYGVFLKFGPKWFGVVMFGVWVVLSTVLLANLLIAMMNQTFSACAARAQKRWLLERLRITMSIQSELFSWQVWGWRGLRNSLRDLFSWKTPDTRQWYWKYPSGASPHPEESHDFYDSLNQSKLRYWVDDAQCFDQTTLHRHYIAVHLPAKVTLRVSGLPRRWRDGQLRDLVLAVCESYRRPDSTDPKLWQQLISVRVLVDQLTAISKAMGLVTFADGEAAAEVLELLDGLEVEEGWTRPHGWSCAPLASTSIMKGRVTPLREVGMGLHRGSYRLSVELCEGIPEE